MTSTLSILNNVTTPLKRCINEIIVLIPLSDTNVVNLNGTVHNVQSGLIINNCDLYQYLHVNDLIELKMPLTLFVERESSLANCYFDFALLKNYKTLYGILTRNLRIEHSNTTITTTDISNIISLLLKEAKTELSCQYLPQFMSKHKLLNDILDYINSHLNETIHTKTVAQHFFISQSYISILFSNVMHMHFKNYVISLKIALSLNDLLSPNESIQSVARRYNFMNLSTFTKHFKAYLNVPPKVYVHQFNRQMSICHSSLKINTIAQDYNTLLVTNHANTTTPLAYTLDLNHPKESIYLPIPKTLIKVKDIATLSKLMHIQDEYFNLTHFPNPHIYIQQFKENDLTHFNVQLLLAIMPKIISKGCYLMLPLYSKDFYRLLDQYLFKVINDELVYHLYFSHIKLVFQDEHLSTIQISALKQLINNHYPNISLGFLLDNYISQSAITIQSIIDYINNLNMDFYIINQNINLLANKLIYTTNKMAENKPILDFIEALGHCANKVIFTHITRNDINLYFKSYTDTTSVKFIQFLVDLIPRVGGFGFPLLINTNDDIALLNSHTTGLSIVHIYSMLLPFMGQTVQLHDLGLLINRNNHYEIIIYDTCDYTDNLTKHTILIKHNFKHRCQALNQILKSPQIVKNNSTLNNNSLNMLHLDKLLLDNLNKISQPITSITIHDASIPLEISLDKDSIYYLKLYI